MSFPSSYLIQPAPPSSLVLTHTIRNCILKYSSLSTGNLGQTHPVMVMRNGRLKDYNCSVLYSYIQKVDKLAESARPYLYWTA